MKGSRAAVALHSVRVLLQGATQQRDATFCCPPPFPSFPVPAAPRSENSESNWKSLIDIGARLGCGRVRPGKMEELG